MLLLLVSSLQALLVSIEGQRNIDMCTLAPNFEKWYKNNFETFNLDNPFAILDIPNPLCALMTDSISIGCSECSSKLQQWYLSRKCMAACHEHNCAPYNDLVVECDFSPDNFINGPTEELKWGAKCTCPSNTLHAGKEMTIPGTPYKQMLDEYRSNRCFDASAVGCAGAVDCDPFACTTSNISWCDSNAICTTDHSNHRGFTCECQQGYTGDGFDCLKLVICSLLPSIQNGKYVTEEGIDALGEYPGGTTLTVECDAGYGIIGNSTVECEAEDTWTPSALVCIKCSTVPIVSNGKFLAPDGIDASGEYPGGTILTAQCDDEYGVAGDDGPTILCQSSETWYPATKICKASSGYCSTNVECRSESSLCYGDGFGAYEAVTGSYCYDKCSNDSECSGVTRCSTYGYCMCNKDSPCKTNADCCTNSCENLKCTPRKLTDTCKTDMECDSYQLPSGNEQVAGVCNASGLCEGGFGN